MKPFIWIALAVSLVAVPLAFIGCCKPDVAGGAWPNDVDALNAASQAELQKKAQAR